MGFQSSIIAIGSITLQVALNKMGTNAVATQAIVSKIDQFAMLPMISIGLAWQPLEHKIMGLNSTNELIKV